MIVSETKFRDSARGEKMAGRRSHRHRPGERSLDGAKIGQAVFAQFSSNSKLDQCTTWMACRIVLPPLPLALVFFVPFGLITVTMYRKLSSAFPESVISTRNLFPLR